MKRKKILTDPGFWILIGINAYLVFYYYQTPQIFTTLIWLYWCQSVMMGIFNCLDMLTVRTIKVPAENISKESSTLFTSRIGSTVFFTAHYGVFHFVYMMFIYSMKPKYPVNWDLFKYFLMAFFVGQVITFIQHKIQQSKEATALGPMFVTPYIRILPMHLTILVPSFFHISNLGVFLILKGIADVVMYVATKPKPSTRQSDEAALASEQTMNM